MKAVGSVGEVIHRIQLRKTGIARSTITSCESNLSYAYGIHALRSATCYSVSCPRAPRLISIQRSNDRKRFADLTEVSINKTKDKINVVYTEDLRHPEFSAGPL
jgi:hypothetical protein